ncbi:Swt1 family HEPN domain-containing protein [Clostridium sp. CTA-1]
MSSYTFSLPFTNEQFFKGILGEIKRNGEAQLYHYLKGARLYIDDLGTSYYVDGSGRWDATGINIKFYVNPIYIENLDINDGYKKLLSRICENLIPGEVGYDIKKIVFARDLTVDIDEDDDIMYDLENQIKNTSNQILKRILPDDIVIKGQEMSEVYTYLYSVENSLRMFIELVSKEKYGQDYFNKLVITTALRNTISKRKENATSNKWLSLRGDSDLFYLDFKDLGTIINSNWDIFKEYFNSQDFILPKINEMAECRNLIAHNSYIGKTERDLIKSYYNSIIMQISSKFNGEVDE